MPLDPQATDLSPVSLAAAIAAACGLPLSVVCVTGPAADAMQRAEKALQQAWSTARGFGVQVDGLVRVGRPHEKTAAVAKLEGADLLVIGRAVTEADDPAAVAASIAAAIAD